MMCVGSVAHGPWLQASHSGPAKGTITTSWSLGPRPHTHPLLPSIAGRCSFIICEVPVDGSPAQGWGPHHRHLLTPHLSSKTPDQTTLTGCDFPVSLRVPTKFPQLQEARASAQTCSARGAATVVAVYIWGQGSRKTSFKLPGVNKRGQELGAVENRKALNHGNT